MNTNDNTRADYGTPHVPPATPPVVNDNADPDEAANAPVDGDSDDPGRHPAEIQPGQGDQDHPGSSPDELTPDGGDWDEPDTGPIESPPQPDQMPTEAPPPD